MADLKPEAVAAIRALHEQSKVLMEALADLARQSVHEFKKAPGREFMDRSEAMRNVLRIRDAHTRLSHGARAALVALGRTDGVAPVEAPSSTYVQNLWIRDLLKLAEQYNQTRDGTPSKAQAWSDLWKHAHNIGPHWRARAHLAGVPGTPDPLTKLVRLSEELGLYDEPAHVPVYPEWLLYEHDDGRHAVAPNAEEAIFARGDPAWHRVGPVAVYGGQPK